MLWKEYIYIYALLNKKKMIANMLPKKRIINKRRKNDIRQRYKKDQEKKKSYQTFFWIYGGKKKDGPGLGIYKAKLRPLASTVQFNLFTNFCRKIWFDIFEFSRMKFVNDVVGTLDILETTK